jgi:zinc/manganese transport system substrate-binding protein
VDTGLDLELWVPGLVDLSNNPEIRSGQRRYVSASQGVTLLEKPTVLSQGEGDVHIYGNPHFQLSPVAMKQVAQNIATGLAKVDPAHADLYARNASAYADHMDERLVGPELLRLLGPATVDRLLAEPDRLVPFLQAKSYHGKPLLDSLGGWMKEALPLRGRKVVAYHRDLTYFSQVFGLDVVDYIEPRPGIPPHAEHIARLIDEMRQQDIRVVVAANYYDQGQVRDIADRVGAVPVVVPLFPGGAPGVDTFEQLMDNLIGSLLDAFKKADARGGEGHG